VTEARLARVLARRIGSVAGSLVLGQVMVGLTYVVAARRMEPSELGLVATCYAIATVASTVFDAGLTGYTIREVGGGDLTLRQARRLITAKRRLVPLLVLPSTVATLVITRDPVEGLVLGAIGWAVWEAQTGNALLRMEERFAKAVSAQLTGRALGLAVVGGLLLAIPPGRALSVGLATSFAVEALIDYVVLRRNARGAASQADLWAVHRRSYSFGIVALAGIGQQLDTPAVTWGGGPAAGGIYAGAGRLLGPLLFLSWSMALVGAPWLARARADPAGLRREERRIRLTSAALCLAPVGAAAAGPLIIPWVLGDQFAQSGWAFAVLAIGAGLSTLNQGLALILQNRGSEHFVGVTITIGLVTGLVATFVAAALGGPVWAAAGFVISQVYILTRLTLRARTAPARTAEDIGRVGRAADDDQS
jgi:O-antigen/teichoic acid export membrane protein